MKLNLSPTPLLSPALNLTPHPAPSTVTARFRHLPPGKGREQFMAAYVQQLAQQERQRLDQLKNSGHIHLARLTRAMVNAYLDGYTSV